MIKEFNAMVASGMPGIFAKKRVLRAEGDTRLACRSIKS
jgi:hypothetical protein